MSCPALTTNKAAPKSVPVNGSSCIYQLANLLSLLYKRESNINAIYVYPKAPIANANISIRTVCTEASNSRDGT